jgi:hypothetical protein
VPSEVYVHGPGIVLPNLSGKLLDAALFARPVALPEIAVDAIARTERPTAYLALLAAILDGEAQPIADLADPRFADRARKKKEALKRTIKLVGGVGLAVVGVLSFIVPYGWAKGRNYLAKRDLTAAEKEFKSYEPELLLKAEAEAGVSAYNTATANEIAWNEVYKAILATAPPELNPSFENVAISHDQAQLKLVIAASQDGKEVADVANWVAAFENQGSPKAWPASAQIIEGPPKRINVTINAPILMDIKDPITGRYLANRTLAIEKPAGAADPANPTVSGAGPSTTVQGGAKPAAPKGTTTTKAGGK